MEYNFSKDLVQGWVVSKRKALKRAFFILQSELFDEKEAYIEKYYLKRFLMKDRGWADALALFENGARDFKWGQHDRHCDLKLLEYNVNKCDRMTKMIVDTAMNPSQVITLTLTEHSFLRS